MRVLGLLVLVEAGFQKLDRPELGANATFKLRDGFSLKAAGFGCQMMSPSPDGYKNCLAGLENGIRMLDTSHMFRNENIVAGVMKKAGVPREDIFLQVKLMAENEIPETTEEAVDESLEKLNTSFIDLYMMDRSKEGHVTETELATWDTLLAMQKLGKIRSVGVQNYGIQDLEYLIQMKRPLPVLNQIEMHPIHYKKSLPLIEFCTKHEIIVQTYSFHGKGVRPEQDKDVGMPKEAQKAFRTQLKKIAKKYKKKTNQILLRWGHQIGFALAPRVIGVEETDNNLNIFDFELTEEEMEFLTGSSKDAKGKKKKKKNEEKHAEM